MDVDETSLLRSRSPSREALREATLRLTNTGASTPAPDGYVTPTEVLKTFLERGATEPVMDDPADVLKSNGEAEVPNGRSPVTDFQSTSDPVQTDERADLPARSVDVQLAAQFRQISQDANEGSLNEAEVESWISAMRKALVERAQAVAAKKEEEEQSAGGRPRSVADTIDAFIDNMPLPPNSDPGLKERIKRISKAVSDLSSSEARTSSLRSLNQGPKRQSRVLDLRAAAEDQRSIYPELPQDSGVHIPEEQHPSDCVTESALALSSGALDLGGTETPPQLSRRAVIPNRDVANKRRSQYWSTRPTLEGDDEVLSRLTSPTSSWKMKQKPQIPESRRTPRLKINTEHQARPTTACSGAMHEPGRGRSNSSARNRQSRSSSPDRRARSKSTFLQESHRDRSGRSARAAMPMIPLDGLLHILRNQPEALSPNQHATKHEQEQPASRGQSSCMDDYTLSAVRRAMEQSRGPQVVQTTGAIVASSASARNRTSTFSRTARPDPFAPKPEPSFRYHARQAAVPRTREMTGQATAGQCRQPANSANRRGSTMAIRNVSEKDRRPQKPVWERLAQQDTVATSAKDKRRPVHEEARGAEVPGPSSSSTTQCDNIGGAIAEDLEYDEPEYRARPMIGGPPLVQNEEESNADEMSSPRPQEHRRQDSTGKDDQCAMHAISEKRKGKMRAVEVPSRCTDELGQQRPVAPAAFPTPVPYKSASARSGAGVLFTSKAQREPGVPCFQRHALPDSTPKEADLPSEDEYLARIERGHADIGKVVKQAGKRHSQELQPEKPSKNSLRKQVLSAIKKFGNETAGQRTLGLRSRRSLDSLLESEEITRTEELAKAVKAGSSNVLPGSSGKACNVEESSKGPSFLRKHFWKRSTKPARPSRLAPQPELVKEQPSQPTSQPQLNQSSQHSSEPVQRPIELPATDRDGNLKRQSGDTIRVWNEAGANWLKTGAYTEGSNNR